MCREKLADFMKAPDALVAGIYVRSGCLNVAHAALPPLPAHYENGPAQPPDISSGHAPESRAELHDVRDFPRARQHHDDFALPAINDASHPSRTHGAVHLFLSLRCCPDVRLCHFAAAQSVNGTSSTIVATGTRVSPIPAAAAPQSSCTTPKERSGNDASAHSVEHELSRVMNVELLKNTRAMRLDSGWTDRQDFGDFLVAMPLRNQLEHLALALG